MTADSNAYGEVIGQCFINEKLTKRREGRVVKKKNWIGQLLDWGGSGTLNYDMSKPKLNVNSKLKLETAPIRNHQQTSKDFPL